MNIYDDYKEYTDQNNLISPWKDQGSGNGVLYTAQYIAALFRHKKIQKEEQDRLITLYKSCEKVPGLLARAPDNLNHQEGPDDYFGAFYADFILGTGFSDRYLTYGETQGALTYRFKDGQPKFLTKALYYALSFFGKKPVKFVFNNEVDRTFDLSAWMGRFPALKIMAKCVTKRKLSFFESLYAIGTIVVSAMSDKQHYDARTLVYLFGKIVQGNNFFIDLSLRFWDLMLKRHFNRGVGQLLEAYFKNSDHPSVKWLENEFICISKP